MKSFIAHASIVCSLAVVVFNVDMTSAGTYQVGVAPSTVKVMIKGATRGWPFEGTIADNYDLYLARGEHEAMQVVVIATDALTNVSVTVSQPQEITGEGPLNGEADAWLVGHVDVHDNAAYDFEYPPYIVNYHGWYPDPLLTFTNTCDINAGDRVAFWIDVSAVREATAGDYVSTIAVTADGSPTSNVQLNIHVWDFELPQKASLPTIFSINEYMSGDANGGPRPLYEEQYGLDYWANKEIAQQFYDLLLDRRMGPGHMYYTEWDWGTNEYDPVEPYDHIVDWAARGASAVNLKPLGKNPNPDLTTDPFLTSLVSQVSGAGLLDMSFVYGYDESPYADAARAMFNKIHQDYPGLRTMTTINDTTFGIATNLREAVDIWVPRTYRYNQVEAAKLRTEGKDMWWYVCNFPLRPYINFYIEYPAIEPRLLMGAMSYKYQTGGFFGYNIAKWPRWNVNDYPESPLLPENKYKNVPITSGPYTDWYPRTGGRDNGDGSLFCAAVDGPIPTIRTENIRDGLEDYEYLKLLEALVATMSEISEPTSAQLAWSNSAQQLLAVPSNVVVSLSTFTRNPAVLERYREQLASAILTGTSLTLGEDCGPVVTSAVSVKTHGIYGDYGIDVLDRTSNQDIECRGDGVTKLVVAFDFDIQGVGGLDLSDVSLTSGTVNAVNLSASNELTIEMSGTTNGVPLTVAFPGIEYAIAPGAICTDSVCIRQLVGDVRPDGTISCFDRLDVRNATLYPISASNFRPDVVVSDYIDSSDRVAVRDAIGTAFVGTCP